MDFKEARKRIIELDMLEEKVFYECSNSSTISVLRPESPGDVKTEFKEELNLQIYLDKPGQEKFRPNHFRVFINLHLKKESLPDQARPILTALEEIYRGEDPEPLVAEYEDLDFPMQLDPLDVDLYLAQLFMVEQFITWDMDPDRESDYDPPHLFFMGYLRMIFDEAKEIDKLLRSAGNQNHPLVDYTKKDNKNHRDFSESADRFWYLTSQSDLETFT